MDALPLAAAQRRLGRPGRPRKPVAPDATARAAGSPAIDPRLLDVQAAARYLGLSPWTIRDLLAGGKLTRVAIPGPSGRDLRRVLVDRLELDRLVEAWKERPS